jgi:acid stress chaperone HdeB
MTRWLIALAVPLVLVGAQPARAQMTVDVAKITCRQLLFDKIISTKTKSVALWLSGYYHGKKGNTSIDIGDIEKGRDKVEDYCRLNQDITVMDAVEKALGPGK